MSRTAAPTLAALHNDGLCVLNGSRLPARRTLIVIGLARSGTTMVAGALHQLGVDMMAGAPPNAVYEDVELSRALESRDSRLIRQLVAYRNETADVWGWKRPSSLDYLDGLGRHFRNPRYVVVFRDLLAIATRNRVSMRADVVENLAASQRQYGQLIAWVQRARAPLLLLSYEKAMLDKMAFTQALAEFAGADDSRCRQAARFIQRDSPQYLRASRNWGGRGRLGSVDGGTVRGWACWPARDVAVAVEISVNGRATATVTADLPRPDVLKRGLHPTGRCGFLYRCRTGELRPGDIVTARIVDDVVDLPGSGIRVADTPADGRDSVG